MPSSAAVFLKSDILISPSTLFGGSPKRSISSSNTSDDADALPIGIDGTIIDENAQI